MAVERESKAPVNRPSVEYISDFSLGLNTTISGSLLGKNEAQVADDISFEQKGTIVPRKGRRKRYSSPFNTAPSTGIAGYYKNDGTARLVVSSGDSLYYDTPHMSHKWTTKGEFEKAGTSRSALVSTTDTEGSLVFRNSLLGTVGDAETSAVWGLNVRNVTLTNESSVVRFNVGAIRLTLNTAQTVGHTKVRPSGIDVAKHYAISGFLHRGNATSVAITALRADDTVIRTSNLITASAYTKATLKLLPAEVAVMDSIGIEIRGTAGQFAYFDGIVAVEITSAQHTDVNYIAPDYNELEATNVVSNYSTTTALNTGTLNNIDTSNNELKIAIRRGTFLKEFMDNASWSEGVAMSVDIGNSLRLHDTAPNVNIETTTADFSTGTLVGVQAINNNLELANTTSNINITTPGDTIATTGSFQTSVSARPVLLSNGWLVKLAVATTTNPIIRWLGSMNNGSTWSELCSATLTSASNVVSYSLACRGTILYTLVSTATVEPRMYVFDAVTTTSPDIPSPTSLDTGQTGFSTHAGAVSIWFNPAKTRLHCVWLSVNATFPNARNIRYRELTVHSNGTVTSWGTTAQITSFNTATDFVFTPRVVTNISNQPVIIHLYRSGTTTRTVRSSVFNGSTWNTPVVVHTNTNTLGARDAELDAASDAQGIAIAFTAFDGVLSYQQIFTTTSTLGTTWTPVTTHVGTVASNQTPAITKRNGNHVGVAFLGSDGTRFNLFHRNTSADFLAWTQRTLPVSANWLAIAWNGSVFCAISLSQTAATASNWGGVVQRTSHVSGTGITANTIAMACTSEIAFTQPLVTYTDTTLGQLRFYGEGSGTFLSVRGDRTRNSAPLTNTTPTSSSVTWNATTPTDSEVLIQTSLNGGAWTTCTNGGAIPTLVNGVLISSGNIRVRMILSTSNNANLPRLHDLSVVINATSIFVTSGTWQSPVLNPNTTVSNGVLALTSTTPVGTTLTLERSTSTDNVNWSAWSVATLGAVPPNVFVRFRISLTTTNTGLTPEVTLLSLSYPQEHHPTAEWLSPIIDISNMVTTSGTLSWLATLNGCTAEVHARSRFHDSVWSDWVLQVSGANVASTASQIQYRVRLTSNATANATPVVRDLVSNLIASEKAGWWLSEVIDVSNAVNKSNSKVILSSLLNGGQQMVYTRSRPTVDGVWSAWNLILVDGTAMHPPSNFVQILIYMRGRATVVNEVTFNIDGTSTAILLQNGLAIGATYDFTMLRNILIIVNGHDLPRKWDAVTANTVLLGGSPPVLSMIETHQNRVWGVEAENPSRVRYSDILNPEVWQPFNFLDFNPDDGDVITAIHRYGQNLVVSKKRSMALLTGNTSLNYSVVWLEGETGATGMRALTSADKYLAFVAQDGIRFSDLSASILATERLVPSWEGINHRRLNQASVVHWRHSLLVALPTQGSLYNNTVWVYDFLRNSWAIYNGWEVSAWTRFHQYGEDVLLACDSSTGQVYEVMIDGFDDNVPINYKWRSKDFNFAHPERYKLFRSIYLDIDGVAETTTLEIDMIVDGALAGTYTTTIVAGEGVSHTRRILPPLYNAVLGRTLTLEARGRCGIKNVSIEFIVKGAVPGGDY